MLPKVSMRIILLTIIFVANTGYAFDLSCGGLLAIFKDKRKQVDSYVWVGEKPPQAAFKKHFKLEGELKRHLVIGSTLTRITFEHFQKGALQVPGDQVSASTPEEVALFEKSNYEGKPKEVGKVVVTTDKGQIISSETLIGIDVGVQQYKFNDAIVEIGKTVVKLGQKIQSIELVHTHPFPQFIFVDPAGNQKAVLSSLSKGDVDFAKEISSMAKFVKVTIRAITPEGITYTRSILGGQDVTAGPPKR